MESEKIVDAEVVSKEIGPAIDTALAEASRIAANIVDDASRERAVDMGVAMKSKVDDLKAGKKKFYEPARRLADDLYEVFAPRIKQAEAVQRLLSEGISRFDIKKRREAELAKERAEAEARRIQEEADRKRREAEEAERRAKEAAEAEAKRIKDAEEAEQRRILAEKEAEQRRKDEVARLQREETQRKMKEEEDARVRHAEEAQAVGNNDKVETILDRATPIAPIAANVIQAKSQEQLQIENDLAKKAADERAAQEKKNQEDAAAAAERQRLAKEEAEQKAEEARQAEIAAAAAAATAAAAKSVTATRADDRVRTVVTWKWMLDPALTPEEAFMKLAKSVVEGRAPVQYLGFDPHAPEKFRPAAINKDVTALKEHFACDGLKAYPEENKQFLAAKVAA